MGRGAPAAGGADAGTEQGAEGRPGDERSEVKHHGQSAAQRDQSQAPGPPTSGSVRLPGQWPHSKCGQTAAGQHASRGSHGTDGSPRARDVSTQRSEGTPSCAGAGPTW